MHCIWEGDLRRIWDTVRLCRIIENFHYWTVTHYRAWVSSCLSRWQCGLLAIAERSEIGKLKDLGVVYPVNAEDAGWETDETDDLNSNEEIESGELRGSNKHDFDSTEESDSGKDHDSSDEGKSSQTWSCEVLNECILM